ncbi:hypothetical protein BU17DRAFT_87649 [Hysterangium stoloniferum]|nr:hypothetical protein BU17DRAFT_87649 [Hysterangium stoloniferum]
MASTRGKNSRPPSVRGQGLPPAIPQVVDTSSGGAGSPSLPGRTGLVNVEEAPVAENFNSVESLFNAMRDAIVRANDEKRDRNKVRASLRAEGGSDVDADEALEAVPSEGALHSVVTPTAGNRGMSIEMGQDPPERGVGSSSLVSDTQDVGLQNMSEQVNNRDVGGFPPSLPIPAGITAPLMAAINKGGPDLLLALANASSSTSSKYQTVDYLKALPIYDFTEIRHNKLELDPASIPNQILHIAFKKADPDFALWFPAWFEMDKALRIQWNSTSPTVPDPSDMFYILSFERQRACQGLPAQPGDSLQVVPRNVHAASPAPAARSSDTTLSDISHCTMGNTYHPYHGDSFQASASTAKAPTGPLIWTGPSLLSGGEVSSCNRVPAWSSVSGTMPVGPVSSGGQGIHPTLALSAVTPRILHGPVPATNCLCLLPMPYVPDAWRRALLDAGLSTRYPTLVYDMIHGSPIGNPPPLTSTFIPPNLPSAGLDPQFLLQHVQEEIHLGQMSLRLHIQFLVDIFALHPLV